MDWWLVVLCLVGGYQMIHGLVVRGIVSGRRGIPDGLWSGG